MSKKLQQVNTDEYLLSLLPQHDVYVIQTRRKPTLGEKLGLQAAQMADALIPSVVNKLMSEITKLNSSLPMFKDDKF
ncbi:unnamed protein product [Oppiella nova]|uniref:Uncharacterized protein n=1 Tax=Oppiella nova TaxID=334625 RepID=A0A7R9QA36_9ACAR|nr:unnamed protein product [Oppiella nova]CAG2159752.1 unnamed protein product [Oppiella nova]